jgi:hypothetical protein
MAKKHEQDADPNSIWKLPKLPWEWCVALLPFRFQLRVGTGTAYHRSGFAIKGGSLFR